MNIIVENIRNRPIHSNCFVLSQQGLSECVVIDPGTPDCLELQNYFDKHHLTPTYIILTHEHFDHIWGVNKLKDAYSCKIICSNDCANKIVNKKKNMSVFYDQIGFQTYPADIVLEHIGYKYEWNGVMFEFIESKGHTDGSICIQVGDKLFTGDTIIKNNKTVIKLPGGSKEKLQQSLMAIYNKFNGIPIEIYPGHGGKCFLNEIRIDELL